VIHFCPDITNCCLCRTGQICLAYPDDTTRLGARLERAKMVCSREGTRDRKFFEEKPEIETLPWVRSKVIVMNDKRLVAKCPHIERFVCKTSSRSIELINQPINQSINHTTSRSHQIKLREDNFFKKTLPGRLRRGASSRRLRCEPSSVRLRRAHLMTRMADSSEEVYIASFPLFPSVLIHLCFLEQDYTSKSIVLPSVNTDR
jgi:hypothetical protein